MPADKNGFKTIAENRKARHDYFVIESYEAGIELVGTEVKAIRQGGGQQNIHGGPHRYHVQVDLGAVEAACGGGGVNKAVFHLNLRPHGGKTLQVLVNGPHPQVTAARRGHLGPAEAAQQGADEVIGGAHSPCQFVGDAAAANVTAVNFKCVLVDGTDIGTQLLEDLHDYGDVTDLRDIFNTAAAIHQEGGGDDGHSSVLCAADLNFAEQGMSAVNYILLQDDTFFGNE